MVCSVIWVCLGQVIVAVEHDGQTTEPQVRCRPFGTCEPCPEDSVSTFTLFAPVSDWTRVLQLHEPFCKPFGNRRLMHCTHMITSPTSSDPPPPDRPPTKPNAKISTYYQSTQSNHPDLSPDALGETPAWESCGRIPQKEREDFWEFVACNFLFAAMSLFILFARSKRLQTLKGRQLAARIGLVRGDGGGVL